MQPLLGKHFFLGTRNHPYFHLARILRDTYFPIFNFGKRRTILSNFQYISPFQFSPMKAAHFTSYICGIASHNQWNQKSTGYSKIRPTSPGRHPQIQNVSLLRCNGPVCLHRLFPYLSPHISSCECKDGILREPVAATIYRKFQNCCSLWVSHQIIRFSVRLLIHNTGTGHT